MPFDPNLNFSFVAEIIANLLFTVSVAVATKDNISCSQTISIGK